MQNNNNTLNKSNRSKIKIIIQLLALVKPLSLIMVIAIVAGVLGFIAAISIPVLGTYGIFAATNSTSILSLKTIIILCIGAGIIRGILRYIEQLSNHYIAFKILAIIRDKIFGALRKLAPAKLETKHKGTLISIITSDVELLEVFYAHTISPIIIAIIVSAIMTIFIATFHFIFGLVALCGYLFVGIYIPYIITKRGKDDGIKQREDISRINNFILSSLRGMREILQFNQGKKLFETLDKRNKTLAAGHHKLMKHISLTSTLNTIAVCVFPAILLIIGSFFVKNEQLSFASLLIPTVALLSSFGPVIALSNLSNNLLLTFASGNRVLDILEEEPQTKDITNGKDIIFDGVELKNISFNYTEDAPVLNDVSLTINKNKITGISGKSGSGKSTILKLLMRFWSVKKGAIEISGTNIEDINTTSLRQNEALLDQQPVLFNESIEENIRLGNINATRSEIEHAARQASVHDFISSLPQGYDTRIGELGDRLSSGEKQRICLARLFLHNSPLLLLDEPTSNIDCLNEGIILKSLKESSADKTIILISHRKSSLSICDEITSIDSGRVS